MTAEPDASEPESGDPEPQSVPSARTRDGAAFTTEAAGLETGAAGLADLLAGHALLLEGARSSAADDGATAWKLEGIVFAVVRPGAAEYRLRREVAAAALKTPGVTPSPRGANWVTFAPPALDGFAVDRARAWRESAWRIADEAALREG